MKSIELTEDHKSKLLEMCKTLFPEYIDYKRDIIHCTDCLKYNGIIFMYKQDGSNDEFHWFEFCMTHLSTAIYRKLFDFSASNGYMTADTGEEHSYEWSANLYDQVLFLIANPDRITDVKTKWHIVDYLYEEFKKLK